MEEGTVLQQMFISLYQKEQNLYIFQGMNHLSSPFMDSIKECKMTMRKLRKKIYKHSISTKSHPKKNRDSTDQIIEIFRERQIPEFVTDTLRKRRNFDISSIKNIAILTQLPLGEIQNRANMQQRQTNQLYVNHKQRMNELRNKLQQIKAEKNAAMQSQPTGISSTTEESGLFSSESMEQPNGNELEYSRECYQNFSSQSKEQLLCDNYFHLNSVESSLNSELALFNF